MARASLRPGWMGSMHSVPRAWSDPHPNLPRGILRGCWWAARSHPWLPSVPRPLQVEVSLAFPSIYIDSPPCNVHTVCVCVYGVSYRGGCVTQWKCRSSTSRPDHDDAMREYIAGKTHPLTGEQLEIMHLELPPGSMVSFPAHMPHFVAPRKLGAGIRWGLLLTYRQPDPHRRFRSISRNIPDQWRDTHLSGRRAEIFAEF